MSVRCRYLLGGLAPDTDAPMSAAMRAEIRGHWQTIRQRVPGTRFNFDFWTLCTPRRATYPACRAVIAARNQRPACEEAMIHTIQQAYYLHARNPSDTAVLVELAAGLGLDEVRFRADLNAPETQRLLLAEIRMHQRLGVRGFPSLVLERDGEAHHLRINYHDADAILGQISGNQP